MKLKKDFVLRKIVNNWVVLALGEASLNFNRMLTLNETGAMLWNVLAEGGDREKMADALTAEYKVDRETALVDVDAFLNKLLQAGCVE